MSYSIARPLTLYRRPDLLGILDLRSLTNSKKLGNFFCRSFNISDPRSTQRSGTKTFRLFNFLQRVWVTQAVSINSLYLYETKNLSIENHSASHYRHHIHEAILLQFASIYKNLSEIKTQQIHVDNRNDLWHLFRFSSHIKIHIKTYNQLTECST